MNTLSNILKLCDNLLIDQYEKRKYIHKLEKMNKWIYTENKSYNWYAIPYLFDKINEIELLIIEDRYDKKQLFEIRKGILYMVLDRIEFDSENE